MTKEEIYKTLDELNIKYRIVNHKAVFTMEEVIKENIEPYENILKNIFIRDDKKRNYYLVLVCHNKKVNLKELSNKINSRRLSFANEEDLYKYLGLTKGSVSPLGILNDKEHKVTIIIDKDIENIDEVGVHPNINTSTVFMNPKDLEKIFKNNKYEYIEL